MVKVCSIFTFFTHSNSMNSRNENKRDQQSSSNRFAPYPTGSDQKKMKLNQKQSKTLKERSQQEILFKTPIKQDPRPKESPLKDMIQILMEKNSDDFTVEEKQQFNDLMNKKRFKKPTKINLYKRPVLFLRNQLRVPSKTIPIPDPTSIKVDMPTMKRQKTEPLQAIPPATKSPIKVAEPLAPLNATAQTILDSINGFVDDDVYVPKTVNKNVGLNSLFGGPALPNPYTAKMPKMDNVLKKQTIEKQLIVPPQKETIDKKKTVTDSKLGSLTKTDLSFNSSTLDETVSKYSPKPSTPKSSPLKDTSSGASITPGHTFKGPIFQKTSGILGGTKTKTDTINTTVVSKIENGDTKVTPSLPILSHPSLKSPPKSTTHTSTSSTKTDPVGQPINALNFANPTVITSNSVAKTNEYQWTAVQPNLPQWIMDHKSNWATILQQVSVMTLQQLPKYSWSHVNTSSKTSGFENSKSTSMPSSDKLSTSTATTFAPPIPPAAVSGGFNFAAAGFTNKPSGWECSACLTRNDKMDATKCISCETERPGSLSKSTTSTATTFAPPKPPAAVSGGFSFGTGGFSNSSNATAPPSGGSGFGFSFASTQPSQPGQFKFGGAPGSFIGEWKCNSCNENNNAFAQKCTKCDCPKPE
ncbi:hypothetical protein BC833DRAFT_312187 [Globomyces pollinis-pini]|nr:hypothetical protein BC833DRAFT_312187 [Globomyces pollinis-pini]